MSFGFVFLGNPEKKYEDTRHNIGWKVVEELDSNFNINWQSKFKGQYAQINLKTNKIFFLKPQTYMNLSGESVQPFMKFFKLTPEEIIVVHDDLELDFGYLNFKKGGGLAGHNGLKSIAQHIGSKQFYRLRIGISRPSRGDVSSYVLGKFTPDEKISISNILEYSAKIIEFLIENDADKTVNKFKKTKVII